MPVREANIVLGDRYTVNVDSIVGEEGVTYIYGIEDPFRRKYMQFTSANELSDEAILARLRKM